MINHITSLNLLCNLLSAEQMGRSRRAAVPRARECKSKQSNKLVRLRSFFCLHAKMAGGNAKQPKVDIKLSKVIREMCICRTTSRSCCYLCIMVPLEKWCSTLMILPVSAYRMFSFSHLIMRKYICA